MAERDIKSKEDFIELFADKIWDRASLVNPEINYRLHDSDKQRIKKYKK